MPLESCMIIIDNSEYTRNGDYTPTRFQAQAQAVASVFSAKTDSNPESSVGLLTMAGKSPSLLVTPTNDIGRLLSSLSRAQIGGTADLITSIQIAQLALKHRENKNARQRVVVFAASPIDAPESELVKLGKKLRKNNVLIDVVLFGEEGLEAEGKVGGMIEAAGGGDSHLVTVPPGPHLLADIISTSPILFDPELAAVGGGAGGAGAGGDGDMGMDGLDPNMDPELAMAIRMSIQEEEERVRRAAAAEGGAAPSSGSGNARASGSAGGSAPATSSTSAATAAAPGSAADLPSTQTGTLSNAYTAEAPAPGDTDVDVDAAGDAEMTGAGEGAEDEDEDEDEELRRAMALSRGEGAGEGDVDMEGEGDEDEEDEDAAIQRAIQMSLQGDGNGDKDGESK